MLCPASLLYCSRILFRFLLGEREEPNAKKGLEILECRADKFNLFFSPTNCFFQAAKKGGKHRARVGVAELCESGSCTQKATRKKRQNKNPNTQKVQRKKRNGKERQGAEKANVAGIILQWKNLA